MRALFGILLLLVCGKVMASPLVDLAVTTGYIWKNDSRFREVYGKGIQEIVTVDTTFWLSRCAGLGLKGSYWRADGHTVVCRANSSVEQIPIIAYLRAKVGGCLQGFVSIGGGFISTEERSYLGKVDLLTGGAEVEAGINYYFCKCLFAQTAVRYLYFREHAPGTHRSVDFGGYGLRGGIGVTF